MIKLKNINKKYTIWEKENTLYKDLNFKIADWDFIAILWRSWSGKTTFLNMIAWLIWFDSWELTVKNTKYSELSIDELTKFRWENISFIFQSFHLIQNLTVSENIELPIDINKIEKRFSPSDILKKVWLEKKADVYPFTLSWWEQQRVAIARAFIWKTPILLADEPTWNIDEENATRIMKLLKKLHKETKNTIILITHDLSVAQYADKIYELNKNSLYPVKKKNV